MGNFSARIQKNQCVLEKTASLDTEISNLHHSYWADTNLDARKSQLNEAHVEEWVKSGADLELIYLNVRSLHRDEAYSYLIPDPQAVTGKKHPDAQWRHIRKNYSHLENGGWWCNGIDPLTGEPMEWGCFKPSTPRPDFEKPGKVRKYEHPFKTTMRAFFLAVPLEICQKISKRYNIPLPANLQLPSWGMSTTDDLYIYTKAVDVYKTSSTVSIQSTEPPITFWEWVFANNIPITIVEGAKKAGALLSIGIVAIAIPGITAGYRVQQNEHGQAIVRSLIPDLQRFATPGRFVTVCFDYEERPRQLANLNKAITNLSQLFNAAGCVVGVCQLPGPDKGVDDFIKEQGVDAYEQVYRNAFTLDQWEATRFFALTKVSVRINQKFIGNLDFPPGAKLIGIKSYKGSGKTEGLIKIVESRINAGLPTLVLTHRVQLGQAICDRIGLSYVTEIRDSDTGMVLGFGLCVDSLHGKSQARFNASMWEDALVIIDECEQVIWHTLTANTEVKKARPEILEQLSILLRGALTNPKGGVILLDADLSDLSIEFVLGLAGVNVEPYIVLNEWRPETGRKVYVYGKHTGMLEALDREIEQGKKVMIITQAQKPKSKLGTINIETRLRSKFPDLRILRIDSASVSQVKHPACGCISSLNEVLPEYDVVICSPSVETGVSINIRGHFASIWAFMMGVSPVNTACQSVARLRELVPLHLWARNTGMSFVGNRSVNNKALITGQKRAFFSNLTLVGITEYGNCVFNETAIQTWGKMAARVNAGMWNYKDSILASLELEGHTIIDLGEDVYKESELRIKDELKAVKNKNETAHCIAVSKEDTTSMTASEYQKLEAQKLKTPEERDKQLNYEIRQRYGVDVTPELVKQDDEGLYPQLRLMYYLTVGREYLKERDKNVVETMKANGGENLWIPDVNKGMWSVSVTTLEVLGLPALLKEKDRDFRNSDIDLIEFGAKALKFRQGIKDALGVTIPSNATPIVALRILLKKVGIKLKCGGRDGSGERLRYYNLVTPNDKREDIFANWLAKDGAAVS